MARSAAVASAVARAQDTPSFHHEDGRKRRVLYAEDQASARVVTTALLERMGFDVVAVEDGELAFEEAKAAAFDVILLDIEMPVMDGVTAARFIRAEAGPCQDAPILALSAFLADSTEHSVWRDAFDSALPKPANSNELMKAMQRAITCRTPSPGSDLAAPASPTWAAFGRTLPSGVFSLLAKTALQEMNHIILAYASCVEAGDAEGAGLCHHKLKSIATSFDATEVIKALAGRPVASTRAGATELLSPVSCWFARQA